MAERRIVRILKTLNSFKHGCGNRVTINAILLNTRRNYSRICLMKDFKTCKINCVGENNLIFTRTLSAKEFPLPSKGHLVKLLQQDLSEKMKIPVPLSIDEWQKLYGQAHELDIKQLVFGAYVMNACLQNKNYVSAKSYMDYLASLNAKPSVVILSKLMRLSGLCSSDVGEEFIFEVFKQIQDVDTVFEPMTLGDIVVGLCATSRWRECFKLLEENQILGKPRKNDYEAIAIAAFANKDHDAGWQLLNKIENDFKSEAPSLQLCKSLLKNSSETSSREERKEFMNKFLDFCSENQIYLPTECVENIKDWFERECNCSAKYITVKSSGQCPQCKQHLESNLLTNEEFELLQSSFLDRVLVGKDAFLKTTPAELQKFKAFLARTAPYDIVLDALNVAYFGNSTAEPTKKMQQLYNVVRSLVGDKKTVLVIGKQHMLRWKRKYMDYIKKHTFCFFTQDLSKDDPFFLYATLFSGKNTTIVSSDMMRDHCYQLRVSDPVLYSIFKRWLLGHQLYLEKQYPSETIRFSEPILYKTSVQRCKGTIHIPISSTTSLEKSLDPPKAWLCVHKKEGDFKNYAE